MRYAEFTVPLVKAVQEQQVMIEALKKENEALATQLSSVLSELAEIKKMMLVSANNGQK